MVKSRFTFSLEELNILVVLLSSQIARMALHSDGFSPSQRLVFNNYLRLFRKVKAFASRLEFKEIDSY